MKATKQARFYSVLTKIGTQKLTRASHQGQNLVFKYMAVGDGQGNEYQPTPEQTALVNETYRTELESVYIDTVHPDCIVCEHRIPESMGGWTIREVGIFDDEGDLVAVGNFPATYKPTLMDNAHRVQVVRLVVQVNAVEHVAVRVDNSIAFATREDFTQLTQRMNALEQHCAHLSADLIQAQKTLSQHAADLESVRALAQRELSWSASAMTGYINGYDALMNYQLPEGCVMTGLYSHHSNNHEDRAFRIYYKKLTRQFVNDNNVIFYAGIAFTS